MNAKPVVQVLSRSAISAKSALKILKRFSQAAQASIDEQGLDLTNRERESSVSQDVLEHLVMIETALHEEVKWLANKGNGGDGSKTPKISSFSSSVSKAAKEVLVEAGGVSKSGSGGKKRLFDQTQQQEEDTAESAEAAKGVVEAAAGSAKKEKKEKKDKKDRKDKKEENEDGKRQRRA